ncbi:aminomethyl-transferring glycine dehydrogenase subunit GcvPB [Sandaracinobacteroides saxicola]|uniref:glycine dehydrogenase (aminomethyl-transferring) n=1 Tax=Sandaracinobacteroides saxicola TaxID=2759707 RepID=A0A7G5IKY7_9SPHN|nr:aminomethyl-transferring glycine dehydrogenase subunit GcvPB [Sandaracinobacteroides saxicola]QMW24029.1 aminomethyl-transferring glycine dehydrogenase subunit GcvPB [Sandaracinobacteroides saxicola]
MMNAQGRPTAPVAANADAPAGITGNRALMLEEPLLFEKGSPDRCGVDLPPVPAVASRLGGLDRHRPIGLAGLAEGEVVRHFTRLSRQNYAIDMGIFPLGSCTMKHNPRLNEKMARLPGFGDIHPLQPQDTVQGALELIHRLADWLCKLTNMPAVSMSPKAGAHGELCGMLAIRAAQEAKGDARSVVLVPESAHGTNPATAAFCGYRVEDIPANAAGRVDLAALKARLGPDVAAVMITNPNTCGLFEPDMIDICAAVHAAGAFVYCDGANFNAIVGKVRPGDLGIDAMHINLHKTFSTPHGGGGPGSGPVVFSAALAPFAPLPFVEHQHGRFELIEEEQAHASAAHDHSFGRMVAFHGQMGMYVRALAYIMSHGADGLRQVAEDAVLNANYILARCKDVMSAPFGDSGPCMHEALFSDDFLEGTGVSTLDFAKAMIDEGFHPMTMYFPLVVHGAMLIEPTETESRANLDQLIEVLRGLALAAKAGDSARFAAAPYHAPRARLDETLAARKPVLSWREPAPAAAAE